MPLNPFNRLKNKHEKRDVGDSSSLYNIASAGALANGDVSAERLSHIRSLRNVSTREKRPHKTAISDGQNTQQNHDQMTIPPASDLRQMSSQSSQSKNYQPQQAIHSIDDSVDDIETDLELNSRHQHRPDLSAQPHDDLWSWIPHVSQPADDQTVINRVTDVLNMAAQFVRYFYCDRPISEIEVSRYVSDTDFDPPLMTAESLRKELAGNEYQTPLIKHWLIARLLSLISFDPDAPAQSLLPVEFKSYATLAASRIRSKAIEDEVFPPYLQPALSAYRVLSAYIRPDFQNDKNYLRTRGKLIEEVATWFDASFEYWNNQKPSNQRRAVLIELLEKTGDLGVFLFEQPSVFLFDWAVSQQELVNNGFPIWPRMGKVFDHKGQIIDPVDCMIHMKYGPIDPWPAHGSRQLMMLTRPTTSLPRAVVPSSNTLPQITRSAFSNLPPNTESQPLEFQSRDTIQRASILSYRTRYKVEVKGPQPVEAPDSVGSLGPPPRDRPEKMHTMEEIRSGKQEISQKSVRDQYSDNVHHPDLDVSPSPSQEIRPSRHEYRERLQRQTLSSGPSRKLNQPSKEREIERMPPDLLSSS